MYINLRFLAIFFFLIVFACFTLKRSTDVLVESQFLDFGWAFETRDSSEQRPYVYGYGSFYLSLICGLLVLSAMHLWSPRRDRLNAHKRSMSSPTTALVTGLASSSSQQVSSLVTTTIENEGEVIPRGEGEEGDKKSFTEVAREGVSAARDALLGSGMGLGSEILGKAGKEKRDDGWAPGLFYAYARRVSFLFICFRGLWERLYVVGTGCFASLVPKELVKSWRVRRAQSTIPY